MKPRLGRLSERYREIGALLSRHHTSGPFVFCDYWASVLSLKRIMRPSLTQQGYLSLDIFRQALDRPQARLPRLRYYLLALILGPGFLPYRLAFNLALLLKPKSKVKVFGQADFLLDQYHLDLRPEDDPRWVRVRAKGQEIEEPVLNPEFVSVENGNFFPSYKILVAALFTVLLSLVFLPALREVEALAGLRPGFGIITYPLLVVVLQLLMGDFLTAVLAPLPVYGVSLLLSITDSIWGFVSGMVGAGLLFFLVEWFFIPRGLPPSLFLYVNRQESPLFPYADGHSPYWLTGRYYWVWRFVSLAPAEIHKFWEKDWERMEIWVRADQGADAGRLEWMVTDVHFRELWFNYHRVIRPGAQRSHEARRRDAVLSNGGPLVWIVETDMHFLTHTPEIRGVFLSKPRPPLRDRTLLRILRTLVHRRRFDNYRLYMEEIERTEVNTGEFLNDMADLFRGVIVRALFRLPWSYWRYPKGVCSSPRLYLYDGDRLAQAEPSPASDPRYQIKAFKEEVPAAGLLLRGRDR